MVNLVHKLPLKVEIMQVIKTMPILFIEEEEKKKILRYWMPDSYSSFENKINKKIE